MWRIDNQDDSDSCWIYYEVNNLVASVPGEANARLIATAPELLAMLEKLEFSKSSTAIGEDWKIRYVPTCPVCSGLRTHRNDFKLNLLLQKARGECLKNT